MQAKQFEIDGQQEENTTFNGSFNEAYDICLDIKEFINNNMIEICLRRPVNYEFFLFVLMLKLMTVLALNTKISCFYKKS